MTENEAIEVLELVEKKLGINRPPLTAYVHTSSLMQSIEDEGYSISQSMMKAITNLEYCIQDELDARMLEDKS